MECQPRCDHRCQTNTVITGRTTDSPHPAPGCQTIYGSVNDAEHQDHVEQRDVSDRPGLAKIDEQKTGGNAEPEIGLAERAEVLMALFKMGGLAAGGVAPSSIQ